MAATAERASSAGAAIPSGNDGPGNVQSVSIGYFPTPKLTVLVNGGRAHKFARVRQFPDRFYREPGGTLQFVSGEVRFVLRSSERILRMRWRARALASGVGPKPLSSPSRTPHTWCSAGGGLVVPLGPHLRASGDMGFLLLIERDVPHIFRRSARASPGVSEDSPARPSFRPTSNSAFPHRLLTTSGR